MSASVTYVPNDEHVVVLSTDGSQVLLVHGERETLNEDLVKLEPVNEGQTVEIPNDNVSLESHVCFLA